MLTDKVLDWLGSTGFPLEMEAAFAFREAGFLVRQSVVYTDPQSDKGREIDVLANDADFIGVIDISFVVECKSSPQPWVIFTSEDAFSLYNRVHAFAVTSGAAKDALSERCGQDWWNKWIARPEYGGYGFRQALRKDADPAYTAAIGAVKACHGIVQDRTSSSIPLLAFAFPVVVVDSPLFECSRNVDGTLKLVEVQISEFLFSAHIPESIGCSVKVVTKSHLQTFAKWAREIATEIRKEFQEEQDNAFKFSGN